jgi:hypothetical protein
MAQVLLFSLRRDYERAFMVFLRAPNPIVRMQIFKWLSGTIMELQL